MNIGQFIIDILRLKYFRKKAYATNNVTINLNESNICEIKDINFLTNVVISEGGGGNRM